MSKETKQFLEMVKAQFEIIEQKITVSHYCEKCDAVTIHRLIRETELDEVYECSCGCGSQLSFRVR